MKKFKQIHLEKPNTLENYLSEKERMEIESLKITGVIGRKDFDKVLDGMCEVWGEYNDDDDFTPDYESAAALKCLDMGEATYVDGDELPYFGFHTQLETCILPKGIKTTIDGADTETGLSESEKLKTLVLPNGLKTVAGFQCCPNLTGLILPEGLETIESFAFSGCNAITQMHIPASVKELDGSCFAGCKIAAFEVDSNNPYFTSVDGAIYNKDLTTLVAFPSAFPNKHFVVPQSVQVIGDLAFMDSQIDTIELPEGLSTIEGWAFQCSTIRSIEIPDSVTTIGELAFRFCLELENVRLPNGLTEILEQTFNSCRNLKKIAIPASVKNIENSAFLNNNLQTIIMNGSLPPKMKYEKYYDCQEYGNIELLVPKDAVETYKKCSGWRSFKIKGV